MIAQQQRVKVGTVKLAPPIDHQSARHASEALHTDAQGHHAGAVARRIKRQVDAEDATGERIHQERHPGFAEVGLPVTDDTNTTSNSVWSRWTMAKGRLPCRGVVEVSSKIQGSWA